LSHLKRQLSIDHGNIFAINVLLYLFFKHEGCSWVDESAQTDASISRQTKDPSTKIDGVYLEQIYLALIENKRLRSRYNPLIQTIESLITPSASTSQT
jgi:hypothetical protein